MITKRPLVFFDGFCGLCNGFVDFILDSQARNQFYFAPLQGKEAQLRLSSQDREATDSVIVLTPEETLLKSFQAVIYILKRMSFPYVVMASFLSLLPGLLLETLYRFVARHRYKFFGKREFCRKPSPEELSYFLD